MNTENNGKLITDLPKVGDNVVLISAILPDFWSANRRVERAVPVESARIMTTLSFNEKTALLVKRVGKKVLVTSARARDKDLCCAFSKEKSDIDLSDWGKPFLEGSFVYMYCLNTPSFINECEEVMKNFYIEQLALRVENAKREMEYYADILKKAASEPEVFFNNQKIDLEKSTKSASEFKAKMIDNIDNLF